MANDFSTNSRRFYALGIFLLFIVVAPGCKEKPAKPPPPEVWVMTVNPTNVPVYEEWIGTLVGMVDAQIFAQVTGYLLTQNYTNGSVVKKGDLLFQIDPRPFQAVLDQAVAKLAQDKATQYRTQLDVNRYTPLAKEQAISQQTLDDAVQTNLSALAQIQVDEAAIETAQINLGFTRITSPVDGLAGTAIAQVGNLVSQSSGTLTTVSTIDPIRDYFQVSEQSYLSFWQYPATRPGTNHDFFLELILANGSVFPHKGIFYNADRQVNPSTGTLQIVGLFPNPENLLRPGQYALARAQTYVLTNVFLVPQRAVEQLQGSYQMVVVGTSNIAHIQTVQVGPQVGSNWVIEKGLKPGDQIVVEGIQKAKEGAAVTPKPLATSATNAPPAQASD